MMHPELNKQKGRRSPKKNKTYPQDPRIEALIKLLARVAAENDYNELKAHELKQSLKGKMDD